MTLSRLLAPALLLAVLPAVNMIAGASSATGGPPPVQLVQARGGEAQPAQFGFAAPGFLPGPFGMGGPGMGGPGGALPSPRALCEGRIHVGAAIRAHLRSRLKLDAGPQREAWAKMEALVEPLDLRARELCLALPGEIAAPPAAPDKLAFAEQQLTLRLEMIRLLQTPFREFYQTLSPEQRAVLDRPPMTPWNRQP